MQTETNKVRPLEFLKVQNQRERGRADKGKESEKRRDCRLSKGRNRKEGCNRQSIRGTGKRTATKRTRLSTGLFTTSSDQSPGKVTLKREFEI